MLTRFQRKQLRRMSKADAVELDLAKFAATALGQLINALYGTKVVPAAQYCFPSWYACSRCKQGFRIEQSPHAVVEGHAAVFYRLTDQRPCVLLCRLPALSWTPALIVLQLQSSVPF